MFHYSNDGGLLRWDNGRDFGVLFSLAATVLDGVFASACTYQVILSWVLNFRWLLFSLRNCRNKWDTISYFVPLMFSGIKLQWNCPAVRWIVDSCSFVMFLSSISFAPLWFVLVRDMPWQKYSARFFWIAVVCTDLFWAVLSCSEMSRTVSNGWEIVLSIVVHFRAWPFTVELN